MSEEFHRTVYVRGKEGSMKRRDGEGRYGGSGLGKR